MTRFLPLAVFAAVLAQPVTSRAESVLFGTTGQFQVVNKGAADPNAKLYKSLTPPFYFLIETKTFPQPVLVSTGPIGARLMNSRQDHARSR